MPWLATSALGHRMEWLAAVNKFESACNKAKHFFNFETVHSADKLYVSACNKANYLFNCDAVHSAGEFTMQWIKHSMY